MQPAALETGPQYWVHRQSGLWLRGDYELVQLHGNVGDRVTGLFHKRQRPHPEVRVLHPRRPFHWPSPIAARTARRRKAASASARTAASPGSPWLPGKLRLPPPCPPPSPTPKKTDEGPFPGRSDR